MSTEHEQIHRYAMAVVDAIFDVAPKGEVGAGGTRPVLVMQHVGGALVTVLASVIAETASLSGTREALRTTAKDIAGGLVDLTQNMQAHPETNPFAADAIDMDLLPYGEGTAQ
jgi:hypothetical protein